MADQAKIVLATFRPHADKVDDLLATLETMVEHSRQEPGCETYHLYRSGDAETAFHLFERYRDEEALEAHRASDHYKAYRAELPDLLASPIEVLVLEAVDVAG